MAKWEVRPSPLSNEYKDWQKAREKYIKRISGTTGRTYSKVMQRYGLQYNAYQGGRAGGFSNSSPKGMDVDEPTDLLEHRYIDPNTGKEVAVIENQNKRDDLYFGKVKATKNISQAITEATWDAATKNADGSWLAPQGHIAKLEYSSAKSLLRVEFANNAVNNAVVVYTRVPSSVAEELLYLFRSGNTQYSPLRKEHFERHVVGIRFWSLVRVRHTIHQTRFPFTYETMGANTYVKTSNRPVSNTPKTKKKAVSALHDISQFIPDDSDW